MDSKLNGNGQGRCTRQWPLSCDSAEETSSRSVANQNVSSYLEWYQPLLIDRLRRAAQEVEQSVGRGSRDHAYRRQSIRCRLARDGLFLKTTLFSLRETNESPLNVEGTSRADHALKRPCMTSGSGPVGRLREC